MAKHHGKIRRLAVRGLATAAIGMSLLLPATAFADSLSDLTPPSISLHRSFNDNQVAVQLAKNFADQENSQKAHNSNSSTQNGTVWQNQPNTVKAWASAPAVNIAKPDVSSEASNQAQSGDAMAYGSSTQVDLHSWQGASANATGSATAVNSTGSANGNAGDASADGGDPYQKNYQSTGRGGDPQAEAQSDVQNYPSSEASNDGVSGGSGGAATSGTSCPSGAVTSTNSGRSSSSRASTGNNCGSGATGGAGGGATAKAIAPAGGNSGDAKSTATAGNGGNSGSNTGSNSASANGGTAATKAYGGETGRNTANAVLAGGTAVNSLSVSATSSGNASASTGAATNTGSPSSSTTSNLSQMADPTISQFLTNTPTLNGSLDQDNSQSAKSKQSSSNVASPSTTQKSGQTYTDGDGNTIHP